MINADINKSLLRLHFSRDLSELNKRSIDKVGKAILLVFRLVRRILREKPTFIYFTIMPTGVGFLRDAIFAFVIKLFGCTPIYHLHGKGIKDTVRRTPWMKCIYRRVFSHSNIIHLSEGLLKSEIKDLGPARARFFAVPNGVKELPYKKEVKQGNSLDLLFLSNIQKTKGYFVLLKAFKRLLEKYSNLSLNIIGGFRDKESREISNRFVNEKRMSDNVHFFGPMYDDDKWQILSNADIFLLPTLNDAFPIVLLEAMQFGLPVISTHEGAIPEIVEDGVTGLLTKQGDEKDLADKIELLIKGKELRENMGRKGRQRYLERYKLSKFEENMKKVFDDIAAVESKCKV